MHAVSLWRSSLSFGGGARFVLQISFNKSAVIPPAVLNTTFFNQSEAFNQTALLEVNSSRFLLIV